MNTQTVRVVVSDLVDAMEQEGLDASLAYKALDCLPLEDVEGEVNQGVRVIAAARPLRHRATAAAVTVRRLAREHSLVGQIQMTERCLWELSARLNMERLRTP